MIIKPIHINAPQSLIKTQHDLTEICSLKSDFAHLNKKTFMGHLVMSSLSACTKKQACILHLGLVCVLD